LITKLILIKKYYQLRLLKYPHAPILLLNILPYYHDKNVVWNILDCYIYSYYSFLIIVYDSVKVLYKKTIFEEAEEPTFEEVNLKTEKPTGSYFLTF
jgi:hypothetical protein